MAKKKLFLVKYQGNNKVLMTGSGMALLQQSGASVKKIRVATESDLINYSQL